MSKGKSTKNYTVHETLEKKVYKTTNGTEDTVAAKSFQSIQMISCEL